MTLQKLKAFIKKNKLQTRIDERLRKDFGEVIEAGCTRLIKMSLNMISKTYATFRPDKTYSFRGWRNRAWFTMLNGNKL